MNVSKLERTNNSTSFKAVKAGPIKTYLLKELLNINFYTMDQACMKGLEAYNAKIASPGLGEFLSNVQLTTLRNSPNYKKTLISDTEASKLKLKSPKKVYEKLLEILDKPQKISISKLLNFFKQTKVAEKSNDPKISKNVIKEITEKFDTKLDETDYFIENATRKYPGLVSRRFYPN